MNKDIYKARAELTKALAHAGRIEMIDILSQGERCVCELEEMTGLSQSSVSKHLGILKRAGIVGSRKEGLNAHYYLRTPCIMKFFDCLDNVLLKDLEERQKQLQGGDIND